MAQPIFDISPADLERVKTALRQAQTVIPYGRFAFAMTTRGEGSTEFQVTHWSKPSPYAFEDCKAVGFGTVEEVIDGIHQYTHRYALAHAPVHAVAAE